MNDINRRSFLEIAVGTAVTMKIPFPQSADEAPTSYALGLMRTLNTIQANLRRDDTHFVTRAEMLTQLQKPGIAFRDWAPLMKFDSDEILPGWFLSFVSKPMGYILMLVHPRGPEMELLVTDESSIISHTTIGKNEYIK